MARFFEGFIKYGKLFRNRLWGMLMDKEPLIQNRDIDLYEIWKNILIEASARLGKPLSDEGIRDVNYFILVAAIMVGSITTISIPIINISIAPSLLVLIGLVVHWAIIEFPEFFDKFSKKIVKCWNLVFSLRQEKFLSIINGEKSESQIEYVLSTTKFTQSEYSDIIDSLIKQKKFSEIIQIRIVEAITKFNANILNILKGSFIIKNKYWYTSIVTQFLLIFPKRFRKEISYLTKLSACYPNSSVGLAIGITQGPVINDALVNAGYTLIRRKFFSFEKVLKIVFIIMTFLIWAILGPIVERILVSLKMSEGATGTGFFVFTGGLIYIFYTLHGIFKKRLLMRVIESSIEGIPLQPNERASIIEDFISGIHQEGKTCRWEHYRDYPQGDKLDWESTAQNGGIVVVVKPLK